ncbi:MAG TPA: sigma-54-dependent Fis family transcriptional regulator [Desulfobacteraceae bacterium]|nr:sigma-54-dependent Fis family transcriptional regulator [Deltaproteobacteria bacterium]HDI60257.1 sigma-54-dependent Fis family transcriptional regulator [Desulfobacteraceae bacterium]
MNPANAFSPRILVIDDQPSILLAIDTTLRMAGYNHVTTCQESTRVKDMVGADTPDIVLLDLMMAGVDGETLLEFFNVEHPGLPVIVITGTVDVNTAVRCMKAGAFDYIVKPVEEDRLLACVERASALSALRRENQALRQGLFTARIEHPEAFADIVTRDKQMLAVFQYVEAVARTGQPVLICGETGAGKELVARALHRLSGLDGAFVAVNVGGLDDNVFSDTLFGHTRGAFTGAERDRPGMIEEAAGGTLFLDEIGDLSPASQVKLLRLLQEGEYMPLGVDRPRRSDARVVASTNAPLRELEQSGAFRKDLAYRLRTHEIFLPPLRERREDLPLLVDHFLAKTADALGVPKPEAPPDLVPLLRTYAFAGNVRELESMIFDALSCHRGGPLSLEVFKAHIRRELGTPDAGSPSTSGADGLQFPDPLPTIKETTRRLVEEALERANGNQTVAARMLGISQQALSKRLRQEK